MTDISEMEKSEIVKLSEELKQAKRFHGKDSEEYREVAKEIKEKYPSVRLEGGIKK